MSTATCAGFYQDEHELFEWYPENPPGVPGKHKQWIGRIVTVTGWEPRFSWCGVDPNGHDVHEIHWFGIVKELNRPVPYTELAKIP